MSKMTNSISDMLNLRCCIIQENRDVQPFLASVGLDAREDKSAGRGASLIKGHLKQLSWATGSFALLFLGFGAKKKCDLHCDTISSLCRVIVVA